MAGKRKRSGAEVKARVALQALRGELATAQWAARHGAHQTMVDAWKKQAVEGLASVFSGKEAAQDTARSSEVERQHAKPRRAAEDGLELRLGLAHRRPATPVLKSLANDEVARWRPHFARPAEPIRV